MAHDVFISYARGSSQAAARRLRDDLQAVGLAVFLDEREIPFGAPFPGALASGLLDARVVVVFADERYFERPWCVHEFRVITAAWRAGGADGLAGVVVALPSVGDLASVTAQLPPPLAAASWPNTSQPEALAQTVTDYARRSLPTWRARLDTVNEPTLAQMLSGADVPLPWAQAGDVVLPAPPLRITSGMPTPRGDGLIGRERELWMLVHECATARAFTPARTVALRGLGGSGKSLLAAEFVARYGRFFPAGIVWIDGEAGPSGLHDTCVAIWHTLAPGEPIPGQPLSDEAERRAAFMEGLASRMRAATPSGRLLWVIDGLPEPGRDDAGGLDAWCPVLHHATVFATTRRADSLRHGDATLTVGPLSSDAATRLLTRPPVDVRWMRHDEWACVVRWAGELPLLLAVLREALVDGSLSVEELRRAPSAEPAAESDRLMDSLRSEVDDVSLRSATQVWAVSHRALASDPQMLAAAQRLALLAPVPLPEAVLSALAGGPAVGRLVRRGWLQSAESGDPSRRAFSMHRIPASVLRGGVDRPGDVFAGLFAAMAEHLRTHETPESGGRLGLHLDTAMRRFGLLTEAHTSQAVDALRQLWHTAVGAGHPDYRGVRYLSAAIARMIGDGDAFAQTLRDRTDPSNVDALIAVPHALQPLAGSAVAVQWLAELLRHPVRGVRVSATTHGAALGSPALAEPLLEAILQDGDSGLAAIYAGYLRTPSDVHRALPHMLRALSGEDPTGRRAAAALLGEVLSLHGPSFEAGGFRGAALMTALVNRALIDDDAAVREASARAAGHHAAPDAWNLIRVAVEDGTPGARAQALEVALAYIEAAIAPRAPKAATVERDDTGDMRLSIHLGESAPLLPPDIAATAVQWLTAFEGPTRGAIAAVVVRSPAMLKAASDFCHAQIQTGDPALARIVADAVLAAKPGFVNARWWRALALRRQGDDAAACEELESVLAEVPEFTDAATELGEALLRLGTQAYEHQRFEEAAPRLWRAGELLPQVWQAHHLGALTLYAVGRHQDAEVAASRAIGLHPEIGESYFFRAVARGALGRHVDALEDAKRGAELSPDDERIREYRDQLQAWFDARTAGRS
jgi:tetratricopeptide (TPR) repeat protein